MSDGGAEDGYAPIKWREKTRVLSGPWPFLYSVEPGRKGLIKNVAPAASEESEVWRKARERRPPGSGPRYARKKKILSPVNISLARSS